MAAQGPIHLHRSNRTEVLVAQLVDILRQGPLEPMQEECIVVQGPGMQRWLSIELATHLGVWAHAQFPFPRHLIDDAMRGVLNLGASQASALESGPMLWAVARELLSLPRGQEFAELRHYLDPGDSDKKTRSEQSVAQVERKRFQLASRIAETFDRYTIYRPELLARWEAGHGEGWQPALWRSLAEGQGRRHPGKMLTRFLAEVGKSSAPLKGLPPRVCLFGISSLPPLYMRVLSALAHRVELHLFVLSPSQEYWADLRGRKRDDEAQLEEGNPLLASLGRLSGDFQQVLEDNAEYQESGSDLYRPPAASGGMLSTLQADILHLRHRAPGASDKDSRRPEPLQIAADDNSVSIHSCHSPMREVEVLHDQIVDFLDANPALEARDVIVMTPDIESYAPLIDAVFTSEGKDRPRVPYQIADRSDRASVPVVQAFTKILATLRGRMSANEVLDLLSQNLIADRFELVDDDIDQFKVWVGNAGIRWGVDAGQREQVGQPALDENTWQFGLDRLLLGYSMEGEASELFGGVLPLDAVEGNHAQLLEKLLEFTGALFRFRALVAEPASLEFWATTLSALLATMVQVDDSNVAEHRLVRDGIDKLVADATRANWSGDLRFETILGLLEEAYQSRGSARGFLAGGVTFCQLMPMRSIPFELVCVLGMSDNSFPRSVHPIAFDLMASEPKLGDRNVRDDDRYLFLEAILSARKTLHISYVGRSIHSNAAMPPSVLVGELIEVLSESFFLDSGEVSERVLVQHALQPFSPRYFGRSDDSRFFSYSQVYGLGAASLGSASGSSEEFLRASLPLEAGVAREVSIEQLVRFFSGPAKYFLQQRLGLYLEDEDDALQDREPMALQGLEGYKVGDTLLRRLVLGSSAEESYQLARAGGRLPLGTVGQVYFHDLYRSVSLLSQSALRYMEEPALDSLLFDRVVAQTRLTGTIDKLWPQGRIEFAYKRVARSSELGDWIRHLCLCVVAPKAYSKRSIIFGRVPSNEGMHRVEFSDPGDAERQLEELVKLYWAGQLAPLPFFPGAAREFAKRLGGVPIAELAPDKYQAAMKAAVSAFLGSKNCPGEFAEPYVSQLYKDDSCLSPDFLPIDEPPEYFQNFERSSDLVFTPLFACREHELL